MTCRDCIDEGTATGGPCTEPRHQAGVAAMTAMTAMPAMPVWSGPPDTDAARCRHDDVVERTEQRDRARRWAVALEQECARLADQVRVLTAINSALCDATGLDPATVQHVADVAVAAVAMELGVAP
jgi:hypothetical protein